ncbi:hypothetical protein ACO0R3_003575 [Hanseniaspora guilliermondii]
MTSSKHSEYHTVACFLPKFDTKKDEYPIFQDISALKNIIHTWYIYKYQLSNIILDNKLQFFLDVLLNNNMKKHKALLNLGKVYEWTSEIDLFYDSSYDELMEFIQKIKIEIEKNYLRIEEGCKILIELESCFSSSPNSIKLKKWFEKFTNLMIYDYKHKVLHMDKDTLSEEIAFVKFSGEDGETWNYELLLFDSSSWYKDLLDTLSKISNRSMHTSAVYAKIEADLLIQLRDLFSKYVDRDCDFSVSILKDLELAINLSNQISTGDILSDSFVDFKNFESFNKKKIEILTRIYSFSYVYTENNGNCQMTIFDKLSTLLKFGYTSLTSNQCYEINLLHKSELYKDTNMHEKLLFDLMYYKDCPCCKFFNLFAPKHLKKPYNYTHVSRRLNLNITGLSDMNFIFLDNSDIIGASNVVIESKSYSTLSNVMKDIFSIQVGDFIIPDRVNHIPASKSPICLNYFIERNPILETLWNIMDPSNNETDMFLLLPYGPNTSQNVHNKTDFDDSCKYVKQMFTMYVNDKINRMGFSTFLIEDEKMIKAKMNFISKKHEILSLTEFKFTPYMNYYKNTEAFLL